MIKFFKKRKFNKKLVLNRSKYNFNGLKIYNKGINNVIYISNNFCANKCEIYINGNNNYIFLDSKVRMNYNVIIMYHDNNKFLIKKNSVVFDRTRFILDEGRSIEIGKNCAISYDIEFRTNDSHNIIGKNNKRLNLAKNITINDHVWICQKCLILKGTYINENCIIGAMSLINKYFEEKNAVIAGIPAKIVKTNINWSR